jgi:hypothetical protein
MRGKTLSKACNFKPPCSLPSYQGNASDFSLHW